MSPRSRADNNQSAIVDVLRGRGMELCVDVAVTSQVGEGFPDAVMAHPHPCEHCGRSSWRNLLLEIKRPGADVRPGKQSDFHARWRGPIVIVRTVDDALRAAGVR